MAQTAVDVQVALAGNIYLGAAGGTFPTGTAAPGTAFTEMGFTTEDGVKMTFSVDITEIDAWQSGDPIRLVPTKRPKSIAFTMRQFNPANVIAALGGGSYSTNGTVGTLTLPAATSALASKMIVVDWFDGTIQTRFGIDNMQQQADVEVDLVRTDSVTLPVEFTSVAGTVLPFFVSNAPSFLV